jgi:hypothetical protein
MMNDPQEYEEDELGIEYEEYMLYDIKKRIEEFHDALLLMNAAEEDEEEERQHHEG